MFAQCRQQAAALRVVADYQQRGVLVEDGHRIARRTTRLTDTSALDLRGLQGIELALDARKTQPHQRIEKVVRIVACWNRACCADEAFISAVRRQCRLVNEGQRLPLVVGQLHGAALLVQCHHPIVIRADPVSYRSDRRVPRESPVHGFDKGAWH